MAKNTIELTSENFDKEIKKGNWAVDFFAEWCMPCRNMAPEFEAAAKEMKGKAKFGKVNTADESELAGRFQVLSIPTLIYFKNGEQIGRIGVSVTKAEIVAKAKEVFK